MSIPRSRPRFVNPCSSALRAANRCAAASFLLAAAVLPQAVKISGPLPRIADENVALMAASPDGSRVVYTVRDLNFAVPEPDTTTLYSVPADLGESPVQLNSGTPRFIFSFQISPDGQRVVYHTEEIFITTNQVLVSVPIDGSQAPVRLNNLGATQVTAYVITPDGTRVVYLDNEDGFTQPDLYVVPIDGSEAPLLLSADPGTVESFELGPSGTHVVYRTPGPTSGGNDGNDIFGVPLDGSSAPIRLNDALPQPNSLFDYDISPDGSLVVYSANKVTAGREVFSVPIDRSQAPVKLNSALVTGGNVVFPRGFRIAPGGQRVVYVADQTVDELYELYSVPIDASQAPIRLNAPLVAGGDVQFDPGVYSEGARIRIAPDGTRVVYLADQDVDEVLELYSVPIDGSQAPIQLNGPLVLEGDVSFDGPLEISPDGDLVAYLADQALDHTLELFVAPIDQSQAAVKRNGTLAVEGDVADFSWSADGLRLVYFADQVSDQTFELFSVTSAGSPAPVRLNEPLTSGADLLETAEDVSGFAVHGDGSVLYKANQDVPSLELYRVPIDRSAAPTRLNDPIPLGSIDGQVLDAWFAPDGRHALYRAEGYEAGPTLFSVHLPTRHVERVSGPFLSDPFFDRGVQADVTFTPDGERVLYRAPQDAVGEADLYSAPVAGGAPAIRLSDADSEGRAADFRLSADGTRAVYRSGGFDDSRALHSVAVDGSGAPIRLDSSLEYTEIRDYRITSDGGRVLFIENAEVGEMDQVFELYSVPIDGSQPALRLNPPLGESLDVVALEVGAHPGVVVYLSDQTVDETFHLFAVAVDGSGEPVDLCGSLVSGGDVLDFRFNPQGTRVVFRADKDADEVIDLYSVPVAGGESAARLNLSRPLADVEPDYQISRDGLGVAYRSDQDTNQVLELYVVSIHGVSLPLKRSGPLVGGGDVTGFELEQGDGPSEEHLVYRADQETDNVFELYSSRVDGSGGTPKLNGPLIPPGDVEPSFRITPDRRRVVFTADQERDNVRQLFSAAIDGSEGPREESGALDSAPGVTWFRLAAGKLIYIANQDFAEAAELYLKALRAPPKTRRAP